MTERAVSVGTSLEDVALELVLLFTMQGKDSSRGLIDQLIVLHDVAKPTRRVLASYHLAVR